MLLKGLEASLRSKYLFQNFVRSVNLGRADRGFLADRGKDGINLSTLALLLVPRTVVLSLCCALKRNVPNRLIVYMLVL